MRIVTLLVGLTLAACAGGTPPGEQPAIGAGNPLAAEAANAVPPSAPAPNPQTPRVNQAARGASAPVAPEPQEPPGPDRLTQARADCWMKVEHQKGIRDIDRRIAFVDKCVTEAMKGDAR